MKPTLTTVPPDHSPLVEKIRIENKFGLHLRAAAKLARLAGRFNCSIQIRKEGKTANAKSVLNLLALALHDEEPFEIVAEGEDAEEALKAIRVLISGKFGERE
jgi:phosphotransferase system HPr (HPr) family protein